MEIFSILSQLLGDHQLIKGLTMKKGTAYTHTVSDIFLKLSTPFFNGDIRQEHFGVLHNINSVHLMM